MRSIVISTSVCLSVCPLEYLENHVAKLRQIFVHVARGMARSSSDVVAIRYVLPVL